MFRYYDQLPQSDARVHCKTHVYSARVHTAQHGQLYGFTAMAGRSPPPSDVSVGRYATVGLIL